MRIEQSKKIFTVAMLMASAFVGMETGGYQFCLLKMADEFGMSQTTMGGLVSVHFIAVTTVPLLMGIIADKIGKRITTVFGCVYFFISTLICCTTHSILLFGVGIFFAGASFGSLITTCQAAYSDANMGEGGSVKAAAIFQSALCFGSMAAPLVLNYVLSNTSISWRFMFYMCSAAYAVVIVLLIFSEFPQTSPKQKAVAKAERKISTGFISKILIAVLIGIFMYTCCEASYTYFMDSFFTRVMESPAHGAYALAGFWAAMAISRIVSSKLEKHARKVITICMVCAGLLILTTALCHSPALGVVLATATGVFMGPIWPFILGVGMEKYSESTGTITGAVVLVDGGGAALSTVLVGVMADTIGLRFAFMMFTVILVCAACIVTPLMRERKKS